MVLIGRTDFVEVESPQGFKTVDQIYGVRIAHIDRCHTGRLAVHRNGFFEFAVQHRFSHVNGHQRFTDFRVANPGPRFDVKASALDKAVVIGIARHTARAVTAHFSLGAVRVEHAHADRRNLRGAD